mmetsp:Transcript_11994/g.28015  ORF Transcript_11994/g.28015 Transcript_11994/m.28015 type:complete len:92 (+) Transcript_11994:572-847(+)
MNERMNGSMHAWMELVAEEGSTRITPGWCLSLKTKHRLSTGIEDVCSRFASSYEYYPVQQHHRRSLRDLPPSTLRSTLLTANAWCTIPVLH